MCLATVNSEIFIMFQTLADPLILTASILAEDTIEHFGQSLPKARFLGLLEMFSLLLFCWDLGKGSGDRESSFILLSSLLFYFSFCGHLSHV